MSNEPNAASELYEIKRIGALPVKNSGRGLHDKGDGIIYHNDGAPFLTVDVKEYELGYRLTQKDWGKVATDAMKNKSYPCLKVVLGRDPSPRKRLVVVEETVFLEMLEAYKEWYSE